MRDISTKNNLSCNFFRLVLHTGAGASLGTDRSSGSQCDLGQRGTCQLIHQHREQHHVAHHVAVRELGGCGSHAKCHTGLRQQGDAEVLLDIITAAGPRSAKGKNEKGKRSAARKNAYTSNILSAQTKSNRNMEPRQRAPVGQIKETPSVIAARCHPFPFWHFRATSPGRGSLSQGGRLSGSLREGAVAAGDWGSSIKFYSRR